MKDLIIIGAGGHAKVIIDLVERLAEHKIIGLLDFNIPKGQKVLGYEIFGDESLVKEFSDSVHGIVAIGDNWIRYQCEKKITKLKPTFCFASLIHPSAKIARNVEIGAGTVVMANTVIGPCTQIGAHCKINTGAQLDHDNVLGDFGAFEPGAISGGAVSVGKFSTIALGAQIIHGKKIGEHSIIGAGATVTKDIPDLVVAYGSPARVIRARKPGDKYL